MEIKLDSDELEEAVLEFIKNKYGVTVEISEHDPCMILESSDNLVDHDKSTWKKTFTKIGECDELSFYVKEVSNDNTK